MRLRTATYRSRRNWRCAVRATRCFHHAPRKGPQRWDYWLSPRAEHRRWGIAGWRLGCNDRDAYRRTHHRRLPGAHTRRASGFASSYSGRWLDRAFAGWAGAGDVPSPPRRHLARWRALHRSGSRLLLSDRRAGWSANLVEPGGPLHGFG